MRSRARDAEAVPHTPDEEPLPALVRPVHCDFPTSLTDSLKGSESMGLFTAHVHIHAHETFMIIWND